MENKICIATPVDYSNFGNRLQNYAVHKICYQMGLKPTTFAVEYSYVKGIVPKNKILQFVVRFRLDKLLSRMGKFKSIKKSIASWKFTCMEIDTVYVHSDQELKKLLPKYKFYGIGGDQVLAPFWRNIIKFATFPRMQADRKICFAPSFGSDSLPKEYLDVIMPEIVDIEHLALREQSGCDMVESAVGGKVVRICDPVAMLTKEMWHQAAMEYHMDISGKFMVVYFLGEDLKEYWDYISENANKNGCKVVDVSRNSDSKEASCNPLEFVSLLEQAECIFTDSFHAVMLSIILNKRLVIFERVGGKEMNTRIEELIERYGLEECRYTSQRAERELGFYNNMEVNLLLEVERNKANEYFEKFQLRCGDQEMLASGIQK